MEQTSPGRAWIAACCTALLLCGLSACKEEEQDSSAVENVAPATSDTVSSDDAPKLEASASSEEVSPADETA